MFADAGPLGADVDGNEVEFPESAKVAAPRDGNVKGCADLDAACVAGAGYLVGEPSTPLISLERKEKRESVSPLVPPLSWICFTS